MQQNNSRLTGGCQCGAVRFRAERLGRPSICHCRMCQKAFGGFFGPLVTGYGVTWSRGAPKYFQSSNKVRRGFCRDCGTPLTYEVEGENSIELAIGAFDDPTVAAPEIQVNPRDKLPFFDTLTELPVRTQYSPQWPAFMASLHSHQHPDHDTAVWPPEEGFPS
ncbi:MAG: GFA family protein [Devosia sp.]|nr:GFA family protein [Devosia sp.]